MLKRFYNLKLGVKISILSINFIFFLLVIGALSILSLYGQNEVIRDINNGRLVPVYDLGEARAHLLSIRLNVRTHLTASTLEEKRVLEKDIYEHEKDMRGSIEKYARTKPDSSSEKALAALRDACKAYEESKDITLQYSDEFKMEEALNNANGDAGAKFQSALKAFDKLIKLQIDDADHMYRESQKRFDFTYKLFVFLLLLSICIGAAVSMLTIRAVVSPVRKVAAKLKDIAQKGGDLTQRMGLEGRDEVGQLSKNFDLFMDKLQSIVRDVKSSASIISSSSRQLSAATSESNKALEQVAQTINAIANGTTENVAVTEETTAGLNEAVRFSEATAQASKKTSENSIRVKAAAEGGADQVNEIVTTIETISESSKQVAAVISDLGESSRKIGDIVRFITAISEQTNLLALNAAIEAARAGEAGRGFNVVAEEIRKLADESGRAARDIVALIKENQSKAGNAVKTVGEVDSMVAKGVERSVEVKNSIDNIIMNIRDIVRQIGNIDNAVGEQAAVSEEIMRAMNSIAENANDTAAGIEQMSASVQEHVGTMEEIEATAHQLLEMAEKLNSVTSGFKV